MQLQFLGTGTSTGIPQIGCHCAACSSLDPCDKRLRASAIVTVGDTRLLIDCSPDFREQILRAGSPDLDALLITHIHYDHVGGLDDMRYYTAQGPFPVYCRADVASDLRERLPYCFAEKLYPGVPTFDIHLIDTEPFTVNGIEIVPLPVMHYRLPIVGFRIGPLAYVTDCKTMPESTIELLQGVDTLVLNALRHNEHMSHLSLPQALELVARIKPRRTLLTHMSHDMGPQALVELPDGVSFAHDFLTVDVPE